MGQENVYSTAQDTYTIGIVDGVFLALQNRLLQEGHRLKVYIPHFQVSEPIPADQFNVTAAFNHNDNIEHVIHIADLADCDFVICETLNNEGCYDYLTALGVRVMGHSTAATLLETDRTFAKTILKREGILDHGLDLPECWEFDSAEQCEAWLLENQHRKYVIKQNRNSPDAVASPTLVIDDIQSFLPMLKKPSSWFDERGKGGCILEEKIEGQEVCFGAMFNGTRFVGPLYSCIEHKGAQNGDRGNIMTGEVGTTLEMHTDKTCRMWQVFLAMERYLRGKCVGMIDINTILQPTGDQFFLEFTCRFGRPTLDLQVAKIKDSENLGQLLDISIPGSTSGPAYNSRADEEFDRYVDRRWKDAYIEGYSVGVTVLTYGYPIVDQVIEQLPPEVREKAWKLVPNSGTVVNLAEDTFDRLPYSAGTVVTLFATWSQQDEAWKLDSRGRHFVMVGHHHTATGAQQRAYTLLEDQNLLGCTWRDDIGDTLSALSVDLRRFKVA